MDAYTSSSTTSHHATESYGYVDKDVMALMRDLARAACSTGKVKYGSCYLASANREVSFYALRKESCHRSCAGAISTSVLVSMLVFVGC
jgi:hypothetical protein